LIREVCDRGYKLKQVSFLLLHPDPLEAAAAAIHLPLDLLLRCTKPESSDDD
jgi:hypothetical protein